jgi:hypothetical protein
VGVIKKKDPTGNIHRWYVNTGKVKGFVPSKILIPYQKNSSVTPPKLIPKQVTPNSSIAQHQYKQYLKVIYNKIYTKTDKKIIFLKFL